MGLFSNKKKEEKNEFGLIGASEWMNEQAKTAKDFNDEDNFALLFFLFVTK